MSDKLNLDDLERRSWRYDAQDGLVELLAGILFFFIARSVVDPHLAWVPALLIFPMRWAMKFFKERFSYPRIGYVKLKSEDGAELGRGMLTYLMLVLVIFVVGLALLGDITSWAHWMKWMPALVGGFCSGGFLYMAQKSRLVRHYFLFVFCVGWGIACSLMQTPFPRAGLQRWALGLGLVCLVMGVATFLVFLRRHPRRDQGKLHEHA
jgi:hypothetical protein